MPSWLNSGTYNVANAAVGGITDFLVGGIQADMQKSSQAYSNTMRQLSAAQQSNAVARNTAAVQDNAVRLSASLSQQAMKDRGLAEVGAAAAGVAGGSVDRTLLGLRRSALSANDARLRNMDSSLIALSQERKNIKMASIFGEDISVIPRPDPASALLGIGVSMINAYDATKPSGYQIADNVNAMDWLFNK